LKHFPFILAAIFFWYLYAHKAITVSMPPFDITKFLETFYGQLVFILTVLLLSYLLSRLLRYWMRSYLHSSTLVLKTNPTNYYFVMNSVSVLVYLLALVVILYVVPGGRSLALSLFAGAGIFAAIIGFASQQAFSNVISGIFIVIFKPFRVDDIVEIGKGYSGVVEDITLRHTVIRDFQYRRIIIPNAVINNETVLNYSIRDERIYRHVEIRVAYHADIAAAKHIMEELATAHPLCIDNRHPDEVTAGSPKVQTRVVRLEESAVVLRLWAWCRNPDEAFELHCSLNESILAAFIAAGIPFGLPHREVHWTGPEPAAPSSPSSKA
jgi:small conductance mechanosensitive channel